MMYGYTYSRLLTVDDNADETTDNPMFNGKVGVRRIQTFELIIQLSDQKGYISDLNILIQTVQQFDSQVVI